MFENMTFEEAKKALIERYKDYVKCYNGALYCLENKIATDMARDHALFLYNCATHPQDYMEETLDEFDEKFNTDSSEIIEQYIIEKAKFDVKMFSKTLTGFDAKAFCEKWGPLYDF